MVVLSLRGSLPSSYTLVYLIYIALSVTRLVLGEKAVPLPLQDDIHTPGHTSEVVSASLSRDFNVPCVGYTWNLLGSHSLALHNQPFLKFKIFHVYQEHISKSM